MVSLRFETRPSLTGLVVDLYDAEGAAVGTPDYACAEVTAGIGLYTCDVGELTGLVFVVASVGGVVIGNGWANLDAVSGGYVEVYDNYQQAAAAFGLGTTGGRLSVDYSTDYLLLDGVEDGGYRFGPQRAFPATEPTAPSEGLKVLRCNPTQQELAIAAGSVGIEPEDCVFVIFANTLRDASVDGVAGDLIKAANGDFIELADGDYQILTCKRTMDTTQYRCYCRKASAA